MTLGHVQTRLSRGLARAARAIGEEYALHRPCGPARPLSPTTLRLQIPVALHGAGTRWEEVPSHGEALWNAVLDTRHSQAGDYLQGPLGTFFIASQAPLLPVLCVMTNRVLTVTRPDGSLRAGVNGYGGVQACERMLLLDCWPASLLAARVGAHHGSALPGTPGPGGWTVLLPPSAQPEDGPLRAGDLLSDDESFTAIITAVEISDLGWRLSAIQAVV